VVANPFFCRERLVVAVYGLLQHTLEMQGDGCVFALEEGRNIVKAYAEWHKISLDGGEKY
jgi:hypothetical protein